MADYNDFVRMYSLGEYGDGLSFQYAIPQLTRSSEESDTVVLEQLASIKRGLIQCKSNPLVNDNYVELKGSIILCIGSEKSGKSKLISTLEQCSDIVENDIVFLKINGYEINFLTTFYSLSQISDTILIVLDLSHPITDSNIRAYLSSTIDVLNQKYYTRISTLIIAFNKLDKINPVNNIEDLKQGIKDYLFDTIKVNSINAWFVDGDMVSGSLVEKIVPILQCISEKHSNSSARARGRFRMLFNNIQANNSNLLCISGMGKLNDITLSCYDYYKKTSSGMTSILHNVSFDETGIPSNGLMKILDKDITPCKSIKLQDLPKDTSILIADSSLINCNVIDVEVLSNNVKNTYTSCVIIIGSQVYDADVVRTYVRTGSSVRDIIGSNNPLQTCNYVTIRSSDKILCDISHSIEDMNALSSGYILTFPAQQRILFRIIAAYK